MRHEKFFFCSGIHLFISSWASSKSEVDSLQWGKNHHRIQFSVSIIELRKERSVSPSFPFSRPVRDWRREGRGESGRKDVAKQAAHYAACIRWKNHWSVSCFGINLLRACPPCSWHAAFFLLRDKGDIGKPVRTHVNRCGAVSLSSCTLQSCSLSRISTFVYRGYTIAARIQESHRATALLKWHVETPRETFASRRNRAIDQLIDAAIIFGSDSVLLSHVWSRVSPASAKWYN